MPRPPFYRPPGSGPIHPLETNWRSQLAKSQAAAATRQATAVTAPPSGNSVTYTAKAPLLLTGSTFSLPLASATGDGYLSAADWAVFNAKEPALGNPASNGYGLVSTTAGVRSWTALEAALGTPVTDGFALVSTAAGVRSWARCSTQPRAFAARATAYAALTTDEILTGDATGGAFSITLPTAVGITGRAYTIKRINSGANAVTVATTGGQTIDGAATVALSTQWQVLRVVSDGANWLSI
jgi:hypothetical protein